MVVPSEEKIDLEELRGKVLERAFSYYLAHSMSESQRDADPHRQLQFINSLLPPVNIMNSSELLVLVREVLQRASPRQELVAKLQNAVWNSPSPWLDEDLEEFARELAYDLDFYEPDPISRAEDPSFYDDVELDSRLGSAFTMLSRRAGEVG